jgi:hypothetical protein
MADETVKRHGRPRGSKASYETRRRIAMGALAAWARRKNEAATLTGPYLWQGQLPLPAWNIKARVPANGDPPEYRSTSGDAWRPAQSFDRHLAYHLARLTVDPAYAKHWRSEPAEVPAGVDEVKP